MKTFLDYVAEDILRKFGNQLSQTVIVFPNKRASLFLNDALAKGATVPMWSPRYTTISQLFSENSTLTVADNIKLVCDLHRSFVEQTGTTETLDHFYGWGQLLLADFDDIDKNLANAEQLFSNLSNIHEMDGIDYLTEEQVSALQRFFSNFSEDHNSRIKEKFLKLWSKFGDIYRDYRRRLSEQQLAYEGMLYREVAERGDVNLPFERYIFIGFNLLQKSEQRLFQMAKQTGKAHFYWDFDHYYMEENEAGHYIKQLLSIFPNELDNDNDEIYGCLCKERTITVANAQSENIQARYAGVWLQHNGRIEAGRRTAIVLCSERLLPALVHSLPDELQEVNVTTGYPLDATPIASFITALIELQTNGFDRQRELYRQRQVNTILRHPYGRLLSPRCAELLTTLATNRIFYPATQELALDEMLTMLFTPTSTDPDNPTLRLAEWLTEVVRQTGIASRQLDEMTTESIFRAYTLLNRVVALMNSGDLIVNETTFHRLLIQMIKTTSIPFHGEPAKGVQIMGTLETRNLDFDHIILLSCQEGNMPKGLGDSSFLPYSIRKAFGLTTIDHKSAIYSYYFHRMIQRAEDITIAYNDSTEGLQTGEISRYVSQLMVESNHHFNRISVQAELPKQQESTATTNDYLEVEKTEQVIQTLLSVFDKDRNRQERPLLTPSAINKYMRCPLIFFYYYVGGLREKDDTEDDEIDNRIFGNILHKAAENLYNKLTQRNKTIEASTLKSLLKDNIAIERAIDEAFSEELFRGKRNLRLNGMQYINRQVLIRFLRNLIEYDARTAPITIIETEKNVQEDYTIKCGEQTFTTTIGGKIDRLDQVGGTVRIIDYKTGSIKKNEIKSLDDIFDKKKIENHSDYYLQAFLYAILVDRKKETDGLVSPALLYVAKADKESFDPTLPLDGMPVTDIRAYSEPFMQHLATIVEEIFNPNVPFRPTEAKKRCDYCPYKELCKRK